MITVTMLGCASRHQAGSSRNESIAPAAPAVARVSESLHNLLETPVLNEGVVPQAGESNVELRVPTSQQLAADGVRYTLVVNGDNNIAWVVKQGGIGDHLGGTIGPWPADDRTVNELQAAIAEYHASEENVQSNKR